MAHDLDYLAKRMVFIAMGITKAVNLTTRDAASLVLYETVIGTPVDVGTARSNWAVSLGGGFVGNTRRAFSPFQSRWRRPRGAGGSLGERGNAGSAVKLGELKIKLRKDDEDIYIQNQLPYIAPLNRGHSKQARPGYINRAVAKAASQTPTRALYHLKREIR